MNNVETGIENKQDGINKEIYDKIIDKEFLSKVPNANLRLIGNSIYLVDNGIFNKGKKGDKDFIGEGNVVFYADINGKTIYNLTAARLYLSTPKGFENAGFVEKLEGKECVLYKKVGDKQLNKIDKYSMEYFKAWEDILFYSAYDENLKYVQNNKLPGDFES
ncbi:MAG: hypothetical protein V3575_05545, partial [Candidatus Absconditabacteria bacterium]